MLQVSAGFGIGGAERIIFHLSRWLSSCGHSVFVADIVTGETDLYGAFQEQGIKIRPMTCSPLPSNGLAKKALWYSRVRVGLFWYIRAIQPDIVHCHNTAWRETAMVCRWAKVPCVWTMHGYHETWLRLQERWTEHALKYTQRLVAVDKGGRELLCRMLPLACGKAVYVPNGIPETYLPVPPPVDWGKHIPEGARLVGMVSRLDEPKDPFTLVDAVAEVRKWIPEVHLLFVGGGNLEGHLREYISRKQHGSCIHLLGTRNDVPTILHHLHVFVLSSLSEGQSLAILEAMSAQRAIVATDVGGNPVLLDEGRCGILVPPRNPQALAEAILELLTNREKAQKLARNARQRFLEHFTIDAMGKRYLEIYERAIEEFRKG